LLGIVPTIAANAYRHRMGRAYNKPQQTLGYVEVTLFFLLISGGMYDFILIYYMNMNILWWTFTALELQWNNCDFNFKSENYFIFLSCLYIFILCLNTELPLYVGQNEWEGVRPPPKISSRSWCLVHFARRTWTQLLNRCCETFELQWIGCLHYNGRSCFCFIWTKTWGSFIIKPITKNILGSQWSCLKNAGNHWICRKHPSIFEGG